MIVCLAAMSLAASPMAMVTPLAQTVETEARELRADLGRVDQPAFQAELRAFSQDAMALSQALRSAGLTDDLPCIFKGISEDTLVKAEAITAARGEMKTLAVGQLAALLDDAILLAPMAAEAAHGPAS